MGSNPTSDVEISVINAPFRLAWCFVDDLQNKPVEVFIYTPKIICELVILTRSMKHEAMFYKYNNYSKFK